MTFVYVTKADSESVREVQDHQHNGALKGVVYLLCRNLEKETWDVFHGWIYKHKDMSKNRKHPPNVWSLASDLLILLRALREYFRSLTRSVTKLRVGELCKRLYCYFLYLRGKPPNRLDSGDLQRLCVDLDFGRDELPSDKETSAFHTWIGASGEDVLWWEDGMRESMLRLP